MSVASRGGIGVRWTIAAVSLVVAWTLVGAGTALSAPMEPVNEGWDPVSSAMNLAGPGGPSEGPPMFGAAFFDENVNFGSTLQASIGSPDDSNSQYLGRCEDVDEGPCTSATRLVVSVLLPACTVSRSRDCVEELYVKKSGGRERGTFVKPWDGQDSYSFGAIEYSAGMTPASGKLPLYALSGMPHEGGDLYAASVQMEFELLRGTLGWEGKAGNLSAQLVPVAEIPFDGSKACQNLGTIHRDRSSCLATGYGMPDVSFGLGIRVSSTFGQWIFGRVLDPQVQLVASGDQVSLDVEGRPGVVPQAVGVVPAQDAPGTTFPRPPQGGTVVSYFPAGSMGSVSFWEQWSPIVGSTSAALKRLWLYRTKDLSFDPLAGCIRPGELAGWISTNAMVYDATVPEFRHTTGTMDFRIGSPALQPDGSSLVSADYQLLLRSDAAECAWHQQKLSAVASVSVIGGAGGDEATSMSVNESDGWLRFSARNVYFPREVNARSVGGSGVLTIRATVPPAMLATEFSSCRAMAKSYADGVRLPGAINTVTVRGKKLVRPALGTPLDSAPMYRKNSRLDRDRDGLACEREPGIR